MEETEGLNLVHPKGTEGTWGLEKAAVVAPVEEQFRQKPRAERLG